MKKKNLREKSGKTSYIINHILFVIICGQSIKRYTVKQDLNLSIVNGEFL